MKKLLLFLALWSGASSAMQADAVPTDAVNTIPAGQDQMNFAVPAAEQASALTSEQQQQAIAQAKKNVQKLADACGDDKELFKKALRQRIEDLTCVAKNTGAHFMSHCELDFYIAVLYGVNYIQPKILQLFEDLKLWEQHLIENSHQILNGDGKQSDKN